MSDYGIFLCGKVDSIEYENVEVIKCTDGIGSGELSECKAWHSGGAASI
ncbi:MAG: hypothetical protein DHS20C17_30340 [Cyclobacteriaceae bacterium]|nr:MAG: hypothetical protein DHS20C17_30340 [Cyclobacteriaceae bacterium]